MTSQFLNPNPKPIKFSLCTTPSITRPVRREYVTGFPDGIDMSDHNSSDHVGSKRKPGRPPTYVFSKPDNELSENERRLKDAVIKRRQRQTRAYHRKKQLKELAEEAGRNERSSYCGESSRYAGAVPYGSGTHYNSHMYSTDSSGTTRVAPPALGSLLPPTSGPYLGQLPPPVNSDNAQKPPSSPHKAEGSRGRGSRDGMYEKDSLIARIESARFYPAPPLADYMDSRVSFGWLS